MSDQVDPITPPIADPQAAVDAALEPVPPAVTPVDPPVVPSSPSSVPMSDETPLAFVTPEPITSVNEPAVIPPVTTIPPATIPPAPEPVINKPKMKSKILLVVVGFFALLGALGVGGYYAYLSFGGAEIPTISYITKFERVNGKVVLNPNYTKDLVIKNDKGDYVSNESERAKDLGLPDPNVVEVKTKGTDESNCNGCLNGGWQVWRNGECKITGICNSGVAGKDTANPMGDPVANATTESACTSTGKGQWCASVDSNGKSYAFCMKNDGSQGNCNNRAVELGYTIQLGIVKCVKDPTNTYYIPDPAMNYNNIVGGVGTIDGVTVYKQVEKQCYDQKMGTGSYICKEGVKGAGGVVYSGGACTELNGKKFTGTLGCFCGVVQVDTGTGHTSYSSTCGCDKTEKTTVDSSLTPTDTTPTMACTELTRTPVTAPSVGQAVTFTCVGSVTPSTAGTLSYKYRYSLNSGAYLPMTSNVLTIAACGSYSVQCQACATLNGVLTCDPTWTGATP